MGNQFIYKKRKKLRHLRHKREADRYYDYLRSEKFEEDLHSSMRQTIENIKNNYKLNENV